MNALSSSALSQRALWWLGFTLLGCLSAAGAESAPLYEVTSMELFANPEAEVVKPPAREPAARHFKVALLEIPLLLLPLIAVYCHPRMQRFWKRESRGRRIAIGIFFVATVAAQATTFLQFDYPHSNDPFPFTRWAMFSGSRTDKPNISLYDFSFETRQGRQFVVEPPDLVETPAVSVQHTKVLALAGMLLGDDPARAEFARRDLGYMSEGLARSYEVSTGEAVVRVHLWLRRFPYGTSLQEIPAAGDPVGATWVFTYDRSKGTDL